MPGTDDALYGRLLVPCTDDINFTCTDDVYGHYLVPCTDDALYGRSFVPCTDDALYGRYLVPCTDVRCTFRVLTLSQFFRFPVRIMPCTDVPGTDDNLLSVRVI